MTLETSELTNIPKITSNTNFKDGIIDFIGGSLGGAMVVYVGQPLDTVKVKMQTFPQLYGNMYDCFVKTLKSEGVVRGLYAGTIPALAANIGENSVLFAGYGACQKLMQRITNTDKMENLSVVSNATAGSLAAFFSSFTLCPTELIKCKLQAMRECTLQSDKPAKFIGPYELTRQIVQLEGFRGLFRGLGSTIAREMPGYFFFFGGYEGTRALLAKEGQSKDDIGAMNTMIAGAAGGLIFWTVIFPADVVKSRIQVQNSCNNLFTETVQIFKQEGIGSLYNGLKPTLLRTVPSTAALFVTYEYTKKFLNYVLS